MAPVTARLLLFVLLASQMHSQPGGFVGSKACSGCHASIYLSFNKTAMGRSITPAGDWNTTVLPSEATVAQPGNARAFRVFHDAAGWHQSESEPDVFTVEHQLAYAVGSGANGLTFLIRRGNYLFQAPLSYYSKTQKWDFSPGYEQVDLGFTRMVPQECVSCHAGRSSPVNDRPGAFNDPPFQELAIGCENCHGPGGEHVKTSGKRAGSIVNPAKLEPRLAENICMNCHQTGENRVLQPGKTFSDFRPGEWLFDTVAILKQPKQSTNADTDLLEHYSAMQASRCFRESKGKLGCLTCHDPHVEPSQTTMSSYFRDKCLTCHTDQSCKLPVQVRAAQTPADDCVGCHMPKRNVAQVSHSALTNHRIPARNGEPIPPVPQTEVDGLVVVNTPAGRQVQLSKLTLLRAYGELAGRSADYQQRYAALLADLGRQQPQDPVVQEALGHKAFAEDKPEEAAAHLQLALPANDPHIYLELGEALAKLGRHEDAIEYLKEGVTLDPYNAVMQKTLILEYITLRAYQEARQHLEQYVDTFPEDSFMRGMLARVSK